MLKVSMVDVAVKTTSFAGMTNIPSSTGTSAVLQSLTSYPVLTCLSSTLTVDPAMCFCSENRVPSSWYLTLCSVAVHRAV